MKKKTVRELLKAQRKERAQARTPSFWVPAEFKDRLVRMFLADPGRFAGSPREFAWRELKRGVEERKRREARA